MRTFVVFGVRVLSEREWRAHVAVDNAERVGRLEVEDVLRRTVAESQAFADKVKAITAENQTQLRGAVAVVLGCNVRLAHRAEVAEAEAEQLRAELAKVLRKS